MNPPRVLKKSSQTLKAACSIEMFVPEPYYHSEKVLVGPESQRLNQFKHKVTSKKAPPPPPTSIQIFINFSDVGKKIEEYQLGQPVNHIYY